MKQAIAKEWVAALRSGEYKQGTGQLRDLENQFCCLGVLCNLHAKAKPKFAAKQLEQEAYGDESAVLPKIVQNWSGIREPMGEFNNGRVKSEYCDLAGMNDSGEDFEYIADFIEKNWRHL